MFLVIYLFMQIYRPQIILYNNIILYYNKRCKFYFTLITCSTIILFIYDYLLMKSWLNIQHILSKSKKLLCLKITILI
jgi:hypothetical protein